jgi:hypothetical protein
LRRLSRLTPFLFILLFLLVFASAEGRAFARNPAPPLSNTAMLSRFAHENRLTSQDVPPPPGSDPPPETGELAQADPFPADTQPAARVETANANPQPDDVSVQGVAQLFDIRANQDFSRAPQNEPTIAVNPTSPNMIVAGGNDYRLGVPTGAAFYSSFDGGATWTDGILPFPLLAGPRPLPEPSSGAAIDEVPNQRQRYRYRISEPISLAAANQFVEPPFGTGDPVIAFGRGRAGSSDPLLTGKSIAYYAYLGVSASFCEHGIFVTRSTDGLAWEQPIVPPLFPPQGFFTPVYWDQLDDCSVFNDKPWIAVDRSGGPHNGRVYVVWARFLYDAAEFQQSTVEMAYSDDNAETWSRPINVSGASQELCPAQVRGREGMCDESQFATAAVGPDGTLYVAFINQQAQGEADGFRNQYLVTSVDPDSFERSGPYRAASMVDGARDLPVNALGQATLCNSNFRLNTAGNLAIDPSDPTGQTLYIVFADNRNGSEFGEDVMVSQQPADSFVCPDGKTTDLDIFIVRSTDGGATWHNPATGLPGDLRVNQDPPGSDQWFPFAAVSPTGRVSVVFNDRRDDFFDRLANAYVATSDDGGATWSEARASSASSNLNWAFDRGFFMGDYNALAFAPDGAGYAAWCDSRSGTPQVRQSDIYTAILPP